jgi:hypothetical protein
MSNQASTRPTEAFPICPPARFLQRWEIRGDGCLTILEP